MVSTHVVLVVVVELIAIIGALVIYTMGYKTIPPNQALVMKRKGRLPDGTTRRMVVIGGGRFMPPGSRSYDLLDLSVHPLRLQLSGLRTTREGNPAKGAIDITVMAKVSAEKGALHESAETLAGKSSEEVLGMTREALEMGLRQMFQEIPYEDIDPDPDRLASNLSRFIISPVEELGMEVRGAQVFHVQAH